MKKAPTLTFTDFIESFPEVKLPIILTEDAQAVFSKENTPLSTSMIEQFIIPIDEGIDEYTEYIACFRIPKTYDFHAIVFWKGGLMNYQFFLATFDKKGNLIQKEPIAGTQVKADSLLRTVATIEEDWKIASVVGVASAKDSLAYDPATTLDSTLELLPDGKIIILT